VLVVLVVLVVVVVVLVVLVVVVVVAVPAVALVVVHARLDFRQCPLMLMLESRSCMFVALSSARI
jgi:hypothetical protein